MGEGFKKLKKKALLIAILKSAVCGLSFGLFAAGAVLLAFKLTAVSIAFWYYIIIGVGAALLCGGLTFLVFKPNDKKLAVEIDSKYGLDERVQTALAFEGASGAVIEMQREDTDARLSSLPKTKLDFSKIWQYFVIALLAVAVVFAAFFTPTKPSEGHTGDDGVDTEVDVPFELSILQISDMTTLINNVKKSELDETTRDYIVKILDQLLSNLFLMEWQSEVRDMVTSAVVKIEKLLWWNANSFNNISQGLSDLNLGALATIVAEGAQVQFDYAVDEYDEVERFYSERTDAVTELIEDPLKSFFDDLSEDLGDTAAQIVTALRTSTIDKSDRLYNILFSFAEGLAQEGKLTGNLRLNFDLALCDELSAQSYRLAMNMYINDNLCMMFGMDVPGYGKFTPGGGQSDDNDDDDEDADKSGGFGRGDVLYGSDDLIYNPDTGEYQKYGEMLSEYYAIVDSLLRNGTYSDELVDSIRAYFEILFSGIKTD